MLMEPKQQQQSHFPRTVRLAMDPLVFFFAILFLPKTHSVASVINRSFFNISMCYFRSFSASFRSLVFNQITLIYKCINHSLLHMTKPSQAIWLHHFINGTNPYF